MKAFGQHTQSGSQTPTRYTLYTVKLLKYLHHLDLKKDHTKFNKQTKTKPISVGANEEMVYTTENCKRQNVRQISLEARVVCIFCFLICNTGLFKMIVEVLTTCHTQYT